MNLKTIMGPLLAVAVLCGGCAGLESHVGSNDVRAASVGPNEGYYAVIDSVEDGSANDSQDGFVVRVRFDDRSYRTVKQASLDGLRVGDSVRIEDGRVRRY